MRRNDFPQSRESAEAATLRVLSRPLGITAAGSRDPAFRRQPTVGSCGGCSIVWLRRRPWRSSTLNLSSFLTDRCDLSTSAPLAPGRRSTKPQAHFFNLLEGVAARIFETDGRAPSAEARLRHAVSLARGNFEQAIAADSSVATLENAVGRGFLFWAYVGDRAVRCNGRREQMARNDYEDAQVLLHVGLGRPAMIVTNDRKFRVAIQRAVSLAQQLDEFAGTLIEVRGWRTLRSAQRRHQHSADGAGSATFYPDFLWWVNGTVWPLARLGSISLTRRSGLSCSQCRPHGRLRS